MQSSSSSLYELNLLFKKKETTSPIAICLNETQNSMSGKGIFLLLEERAYTIRCVMESII